MLGAEPGSRYVFVLRPPPPVPPRLRRRDGPRRRRPPLLDATCLRRDTDSLRSLSSGTARFAPQCLRKNKPTQLGSRQHTSIRKSQRRTHFAPLRSCFAAAPARLPLASLRPRSAGTRVRSSRKEPAAPGGCVSLRCSVPAARRSRPPRSRWSTSARYWAAVPSPPAQPLCSLYFCVSDRGCAYARLAPQRRYPYLNPHCGQ